MDRQELGGDGVTGWVHGREESSVFHQNLLSSLGMGPESEERH